MTAREWLRLHDLTHHALVPLWRAIPKRRRWDIVHLLNRSARTCWCDLVDAALSDTAPDPCDSALPLGSASLECRTRCGWKDHGTEGHECACCQHPADDHDIDDGTCCVDSSCSCPGLVLAEAGA